MIIAFQNGFVECVKDQCPDEQGCYMLQDVFVDTKECCRRCKGKLRQVWHKQTILCTCTHLIS